MGVRLVSRLQPLVLSIIACLLFSALQSTVAYAEPITVARAGRAPAKIVVAEHAGESTRYAASELQRFLGEITGATFEIIPDSAPVGESEIIVGNNRHLTALGIDISLEGLGEEGYILKTVGKHLVIVGGEPRGTLYGVYGLLEDHLGCRWFTPTISRIPKKTDLVLPALDERKVPVLEYREPYTYDCFDGDWAARNRANGNTMRLEPRHGGKVTYFGFVHTFNALVPPEQYFDTHPEYFSLVKGQRLKDHTQLCCTNEDVVQLVIQKVREWMRDHPEAKVFSVSQNDWFNYCECERCTALAEQEESQMGPVLYLVNRVAEVTAKEFPDKIVDTLAYLYTRKPPKHMKPLPNVVIRLCSIECCFSHSFEQCDSEDNRRFVEDVVNWGKVGCRLWVWDYVTSFHSYFVPFPNLHVRADNIRFLVRNGVTGIFEQDVYQTPNGELSPLSGYLNAKLLWDPSHDPNEIIQEFLEGVYGPAAKPINQYIAMLRDKVVRENIHMKIWIDADAPFLTPKILSRADRLWNKAEKRVMHDPELLERVQIARLSPDYAYIENKLRTHPVTEVDHKAFRVYPNLDLDRRIRKWIATAERANVTVMREMGLDFPTYKSRLLNTLALSQKEIEPWDGVSLAQAKPGLTFKYYEYNGEWEVLPDFGSLTPLKEGIAPTASTEPRQRDVYFGLTFDGYLQVPRDGVYRIFLVANDGAKLYLHGKPVVDNDGKHTRREAYGWVGLRKGLHPLRVEYFQDGANHVLHLWWEGPGFKKQEIKPAYFFHAP